MTIVEMVNYIVLIRQAKAMYAMTNGMKVGGFRHECISVVI